jgi:hypothetical protein
MKLSKLAFAAAIAWGIYVGNASAQTYGQQPVRPVAANDYFYQPEASPSDRPPPAPMVEQQAPMGNGVAPYAATTPACDACAEDECACDPWRLFCQKECGWNIYGWVNAGYTYNFHNPPSGFNGPVTFNDRDELMLNQLYLVAEKTIDRESCCWNWGGRADMLYGSDYIFTQSLGWELNPDGTPGWNGNPYYGIAVPQLYAEVGNVNNSIKIGHFYTPIGYEVVPATGNFFYSHAYTMQYGEPFTHWGLLGQYKWSDELALNYGLVNGWDALDRVQDSGAVIGGFTWTGCEDSLAFNIIYGNEQTVTGTFTDRYLHSLVYTRNFSDKWQYIFQHDYGNQVAGDRAGLGSAEWYGINQYLFYTHNDCWKFGGRFEWFRDDDGVRVTGIRPTINQPLAGSGFAGNFFEAALGLNWLPSANLTVRSEIRYDWFDGVAVAGAAPLPYDDGTRADQWIWSIDAIYLF